MIRPYPQICLLLLAAVATSDYPVARSGQAAVQAAGQDTRNIATGHVIPDEGYSDQPYVVITRDGNWLCLLTTSGGHEGAANSHVVSTISTDQGRTWSKPVELEPADGPENVYSLPWVAPSGRVYAFYNYNGDRFQAPKRSDSLGWYVFKYSDDHGRSWSRQRHRLPMPLAAVDRGNTFGGKVQLFWGIGKPIATERMMMFAFARCGKYVINRSEGWFFRSDNIHTESDPTKIEWKLLPDGGVGLKNPDYGEVQAEQNIVPMNDGSIYCMYRTAGDHPCHAVSRDGGHTWTMPEYATYTPGGRRIKNSRACPRIWKTAAGRYLFWFHHHGAQKNPYRGRNPAWLSGGTERDGRIWWSQPEIVLYDTDPKNCRFDPETGIPGPGLGMSYPDLIEQDGRTWISETQKTIARVHEIDGSLLKALWSQGEVKQVARKGLVLDMGEDPPLQPGSVEMPELPDLVQGNGWSVDFWVTFDSFRPGQTILDSRGGPGNSDSINEGPEAIPEGVVVRTTDQGTIRVEMSDGRNQGFWACDRGLLEPGRPHHVAIIVDGGPNVITFVVDGILCDGGTECNYGWGRFPPELGRVRGAGPLRIVPDLDGRLDRLRIYNRYLRTSEAIANYHAGR